MSTHSDKADEAVEMASCILIALMDQKVDEVTAQAALGNAWYRLCQGLGYSPSIFWEMLEGLGIHYEQDFQSNIQS